jgi:dTDP-4-dehydrorhamnose reductase
MKCLVTGGGGQLGRALAETRPEGIELSTLTRAQFDIADPAAMRRVMDEFSPDIVINTAAYTAVDRAESESEAAFRINAEAVGLLTQECASREARLVHFSTDFVFDGSLSRPYRTDDSTAPQGAYGASKLAGECAVLANLPANLVVRTAWVYAAEGANFARTMLRLMAERDEVRVVSDQVGTPTHALSLARATWALIGCEANGLHQFTDAGIASWYDFATAIQEEAILLGLLDRKVPIVPITTAEYPTPARRPTYSVLDKSETWRLLGAPANHWRVELRHMLSLLKGASNG